MASHGSRGSECWGTGRWQLEGAWVKPLLCFPKLHRNHELWIHNTLKQPSGLQKKPAEAEIPAKLITHCRAGLASVTSPWLLIAWGRGATAELSLNGPNCAGT